MMRREVTEDGGKDENVFDIQQGVSISLFVKTGKKKAKELGDVYHCDILGDRNSKYKKLSESNINDFSWNKIEARSPECYFVPIDYSLSENYKKGFSLNDLFLKKSTGVETGDDNYFIRFDSTDFSNDVSDDTERFVGGITYRPFDFRYCYYRNEDLRRAAFANFKHVFNKDNIVLIFPRQSTNSNWDNIQVSKLIVDNRGQYSNKGRAVCPPCNHPLK